MLASVSNGRFRHSINAGDRAAAEMLQERGLHLARHFWHMRIDLEGPGEEPLPQGIELRGVGSEHDRRTVHTIVEETFSDHWGHEPQTIDEWMKDVGGSPYFDPSLWVLASDNGAAVGALTAAVLGGRGWVSDLGVLSSHRRRGIAAALLRHSFTELGHRSVNVVLLAVDAANANGATALYENVGMRVVKQWDIWESRT